MINIIEKFHETGYIFNDIKPDNICIDLENKHQLRLIDFGLVTSYTMDVANLVHIKFSKRKETKGNLAFMSPFSCRQLAQSRRDDLYSILYMLIYITTGYSNFPFNVEGHENILKLKQDLSPVEVCKDTIFLLELAENIY